MILPFWYRLIRVVPEKGPLNWCVCVCVVLTYTYLELACTEYIPDESDGDDAGQRDGELEVSPVADEERQQGKEHPGDRPEQLERRTGERAIHGREQLARHHDTHQARALPTRTPPQPRLMR